MMVNPMFDAIVLSLEDFKDEFIDYKDNDIVFSFDAYFPYFRFHRV